MCKVRAAGTARAPYVRVRSGVCVVQKHEQTIGGEEIWREDAKDAPSDRRIGGVKGAAQWPAPCALRVHSGWCTCVCVCVCACGVGDVVHEDANRHSEERRSGERMQKTRHPIGGSGV